MNRHLLLISAGALALTLTGCYSEGEKDLDVARAALQHRQPNQAIRLTTRALRFGGLNREQQSTAVQLRGRAFLQRAREEGRYVQAALTDANTWITLEPENGFACFHRASINLAVGEKDAALQDLTTGLQKADPTGTKPNRRLAQAYIHRALLLLERKQYEPAEKDLRRAQELDDEDPDLSYARSFLAERDGNAREALHLMERADFLYAQRHKTSYLLEAPMVNNRYFKRLYKLREACGFDPMKRSERFAESVEPAPTGGDDDDDDERLAQPLLPR